jgi:hypothetical protein
MAIGGWLTLAALAAIRFGYFLGKSTPARFSDFDVPDAVTAIVAVALMLFGAALLFAVLVDSPINT